MGGSGPLLLYFIAYMSVVSLCNEAFLAFRMINFTSHLINSSGSFGPPEFTTKMAYGSVQPFSQGSRWWQADRQTDHTIPSVTIDRIYVGLYVVLRCGLIIALRLYVWGPNSFSQNFEHFPAAWKRCWYDVPVRIVTKEQSCDQERRVFPVTRVSITLMYQPILIWQKW